MQAGHAGMDCAADRDGAEASPCRVGGRADLGRELAWGRKSAEHGALLSMGNQRLRGSDPACM